MTVIFEAFMFFKSAAGLSGQLALLFLHQTIVVLLQLDVSFSHAVG